MQETLRFWLNDVLIEERSSPTTTLLRFLRDHAHLRGTKEGCAEGDCGACTVALLEASSSGEATWRAVNACLILLPTLAGRRVYTVEALASGPRPDDLHPAQRAMVTHRASQCGYCTPGIVMSLFAASYRADSLDDDAIDEQLAGNLCRCTGYRPIREAARAVASCRPEDRFRAEARVYRRGDPALAYQHTSRAGAQAIWQPTNLDDLLHLRRAHPLAELVAGATDLGLRVTKRHEHLPELISVSAVPEMLALRTHDAGFEVGAAVTLTRLQETLGPALPALDKMLRVFGSRQIRNMATLGGNLCTASPIGDLGPVLVALGAEAEVAHADGRRRLLIEDFLAGYRQTALAEDEVLVAIHIPRPAATAFASSFKVSKRRELDISTVSAGCYVEVDDGVVEEIRLSFGGMSARPAARAHQAEQALRGGPWTRQAVEAARPLVARDLHPIDDLRGSARYRAALARNLLLGFFLESQRQGAPAPRPVSTVQA